MGRESSQRWLTAASRWLARHPVASLLVSVTWMVLIASAINSSNSSGRWRPLTWLLVVPMGYAAAMSLLLPRLPAFRRLPDAVPILQSTMAWTVFTWAFFATLVLRSPVWFMWIGLGVSCLLLILLLPGLYRRRAGDSGEPGSTTGPSG